MLSCLDCWISQTKMSRSLSKSSLSVSNTREHMLMRPNASSKRLISSISKWVEELISQLKSSGISVRYLSELIAKYVTVRVQNILWLIIASHAVRLFVSWKERDLVYFEVLGSIEINSMMIWSQKISQPMRVLWTIEIDWLNMMLMQRGVLVLSMNVPTGMSSQTILG